VGTPSGVDGAHDMSFIAHVTRSIATALKPGRDRPLTVAYRSTMRPGSMEEIIQPIFAARMGDETKSVIELVYNPEFLREATAIDDYFNPPKIVLGTHDGRPSEKMTRLHEGIDAPIFHIGFREAEITKFVDNAWHAVKVTFANEIGRVCQKLDISAQQVHEIFKADTKLNISANYTQPGGPFGGSCLPKDVRALQHIAGEIGAEAHLVGSLLGSNDAHKRHQFAMAMQGLRADAKILLVGLSFKADTDDLRESPAVDLARKLIDAGYELNIYDPALKMENLVGQNLSYAFALLPGIEGLLVDMSTAEGEKYDRVIATNRLIETLELGDVEIVDASVIP
jgi:GDP-mannose 6-dehydrogenase